MIFIILAKASLLGDTLMEAVGIWLENNKTPGRKVGELDNRGSNYYLALYWAERLAARDSAWHGQRSSLLWMAWSGGQTGFGWHA